MTPAHIRTLDGTDFGNRDTTLKGVHAGLWPQLLLDTAGNVAEALQVLDTVQVVMMEAEGHQATVHLAMEDANGDSAIIKYLDGQRVVHHDRNHVVLTNQPPFAEQTRLLAEQDFSSPSSTTPLAGNVNPIARFQRAAYFTHLLLAAVEDDDGGGVRNAFVAQSRTLELPRFDGAAATLTRSTPTTPDRAGSALGSPPRSSNRQPSPCDTNTAAQR